MSFLPNPGSLIAGKYLVEREIGAGGMGTVYAARHQMMEKRVALKWLRQETATGIAKNRFLREARAVARIRHPHVVDVYDVGEHEGALFLVMEYLEGESFGAFLNRETPALRALLRLLLPVMRGVARAHGEGIVHRDIKPENIFLVRDSEHPDGLAKVLDFGISKLSNDSVAGTVTQTGAVVGTPAYMCKEQLNATKDLDGRVDVYAFGVVLYQALSGVLPFGGGSFMELVLRIATATPTPLSELRPDLPAELCAIVHCAMARERDDRYASMQEFVRALSAFALAQGFITYEEGKASLAPGRAEPPPEALPIVKGVATPPSASLGTDPTLIGQEIVSSTSKRGAESDSRVSVPALDTLARERPRRGLSDLRWVVIGAVCTLSVAGAQLLRVDAAPRAPTAEPLASTSAAKVPNVAASSVATRDAAPPPADPQLDHGGDTKQMHASAPAPETDAQRLVQAAQRARPSARPAARSAQVKTGAVEAPPPDPAVAPAAAEPSSAELRKSVKSRVRLEVDNPWE